MTGGGDGHGVAQLGRFPLSVRDAVGDVGGFGFGYGDGDVSRGRGRAWSASASASALWFHFVFRGGGWTVVENTNETGVED
jgi:hypothetical protein